MSQITLAIQGAQHPEWLLRWQATVIVAFAGGSLIAALCNIAALMTFSIARSAIVRLTVARHRAENHG